MYAREVAGRELTFGVSGKLIMNALVMYDRQTDTLWSQFLGVAVAGPLEGTMLEPLPSRIMEWAQWRDLHPDTLALDQGGRRSDAYASYYRSSSAGVLGESNADDRFQRKEFVLGVQLADAARAYPFRYLNDAPVLNDRLGSTDLVVVFDSNTGGGAVYVRTADGRTLSFEPAEADAGAGAGPLIQDRETGTIWSGLTGEAVRGPLAGEQLEVLPSFAVFWFAWSDFYPTDDNVYEPVVAG